MLSFASVSEFTTYTNYKTSTTLLSIQKHSGMSKCQPWYKITQKSWNTKYQTLKIRKRQKKNIHKEEVRLSSYRNTESTIYSSTMMKRLVEEALNVSINKNAFAYISDPAIGSVAMSGETAFRPRLWKYIMNISSFIIKSFAKRRFFINFAEYIHFHTENN